jgi:hypothetical protein
MLSADTLGGGPWYCRWHWQCESGVIGERIVIESRNYRPQISSYRNHDAEAVFQQTLRDANESAAAYCRERGITTARQARAYVLANRVGKAKPGVEWAHRIMARIADGERVPMIVEQKARAALGDAPTRQPGEDAEAA